MRILFFASVISLFLSSVTGWAAPTPTVASTPAASAANQVDSVSGTAKLKKLTSGKSWDAAPASPLADGEKITTGPDSTAALKFEDGSRATVDANSDFRFIQLPGEVGAPAFHLFKGQAEFQTKGPLTLTAGKNTFAPQAAKFSLSYDSGIKKSHLTVTEGSVTVSNAAQTQTFSAGQELVISGLKFKPILAKGSALASAAVTPTVVLTPAKVALAPTVTATPQGLTQAAPAALSASEPASQTIAAGHGQILRVVGDVQIIDDLTHKSQTAQAGADVTERETIETAVGAMATLEFFDGSQLEISPNTQLQLSTLKKLDSHDKLLHFKLLFGDLVAKVTKLTSTNSAFEVEGGGVVCGVRGTVLHPSYDPARHHFSVTVIEGTVWVLSDGKTSIFTAGQTGDFTTHDGQNPLGGQPPHHGANPGLHDLTNGFHNGNHSNSDNSGDAAQQSLGIHVVVP